MRLYLSSFRNGNRPEALLEVLGNRRRTALIYNACDFLAPDERAASLAQEVGRLESIGLEPAEVDLRDYFADAQPLEQALSLFDLVWVRGGNSFVLRRALQQSGAEKILITLLRSDRVAYGGYSAGICVLSPSLHGLQLVDDPNVVPDRYEPPVIWEGLSLVPYAFAPHFKSPDHPESPEIDKVVAYYIEHQIPFVALRDGQALVINGEKEEVVG